MTAKQRTNPINELLGRLPKSLADQKRKAIEADLLAIGKYEHFRQSVRRSGWKMGDTHVACAAVLMKHLGLTLAFFTGSDEQRAQQLEDLIRQAYASQATTTF